MVSNPTNSMSRLATLSLSPDWLDITYGISAPFRKNIKMLWAILAASVAMFTLTPRKQRLFLFAGGNNSALNLVFSVVNAINIFSIRPTTPNAGQRFGAGQLWGPKRWPTMGAPIPVKPRVPPGLPFARHIAATPIISSHSRFHPAGLTRRSTRTQQPLPARIPHALRFLVPFHRPAGCWAG
jgi:hypothetical protein